MGEIVRFNKDALIEELKQIHRDMVSVYKELFIYKYKNNEEFRNFIENEYKENGIGNDEKEKWNDNFCHRTSYTLINKVLFIRICEDKGFMFNPNEDFIMGEPKDPNIGKKLSARGRDRWISLISNYTFGELLKFAFADMKESFKNIALFKEDKYEKLNPTKQELELKFMLDSKEYKKTPIYSYEENVAKIIEKLDTSKFDFNVPAEGNILGDVYEKFMDRETRKAIGQFYTPDFVIEYILNNTVAEADVVENPFVSVLDPACGSGHFLIMAYDILRKKFEESIDKLREKYADVDYVYKNENMKGKEYWVKDRIHYHILKHCIFGADIDSFAVQLTTINLLLKDLDNFTDELNIMECDSLIKWEEDYDWQDLKQQLKNISMFYTINYKDINGIHRHDTLSRDKAEELVRLCEFWAKKYDYVVGNPPYGSKLSDDSLKKYYMNTYSDVHMRTIDVYNYFISRASKELKGKLGIIIPNSLLTQYEYTKCRKYLLDSFAIKTIIYLGENVFEDNSYPTMILIIENLIDLNNEIHLLDVSDCANNYEKKIKIDNIDKLSLKTKQSVFLKLDQYKFLLIREDLINLILKIKSNHKKLDDICKYVAVGIASGNDKAFVVNLNQIEELDKRLLRKVLVGSNINKYSISYADKYVLYINKDTDVANCEKTLKHLEKYKVQLSSRREAKKGIIRWFELHWPRSPEQFETKKILCRQTGDSLIATIDEDNYYNLNSIIDIVLKEDVKMIYSEEYITAILNSNLMNAYYKLIVQENNKLYAEVKPVVLKELPIPLINSNELPIINEKVKKIIELNQKINSIKFNLTTDVVSNYIKALEEIEEIKVEIKETEKYLNDAIYRIYSMEEDEIEIIEKFLCEKPDITYRTNKEKLEKVITVDRFIEEHVVNNKSLEHIADMYEVKYSDLVTLRQKYIKEYATNEPWKFYNFLQLFNAINEHLKKGTIEILTSAKKYMNIMEIRDALKTLYGNFEELMNIMRKDNPTKKSKDIVKEALNQFADTWNSYTKNINAGKESKELVKYYDSNYYGLSEWDDEIHKEYFIDAIKEYTEISPNEKKARDILKLFEVLNIKDKEDYIEIFNSQIRKAFRK